MNKWLKLLIPIGLGLAAMVLNWMAGRPALEPSYFVRVNVDLKPGDRFTEENLSVLTLHGASPSLDATAIPWKDRSVLYNRECARELKRGDIIFWRDATPPPEEIFLREGEVAWHLSLEGISVSLPRLLKVGDEIGFYLAAVKPKATAANGKNSEPEADQGPVFEYVGPFRVLSIGTKLSTDPAALEKGTGSYERDLTLAVKQVGPDKKLDPMAAKLLQARLASQGGQSGIATVVLHSARHLGKPAEKKKSEK